MVIRSRNSRLDSSRLRQRSKSTFPVLYCKSTHKPIQDKNRRQTFIVMYIDEDDPVPGSRGLNGMGSSDSLYRSGEIGQAQYESNDDLVSAAVRPFDNNPPLPKTQRNVVGNNLNFNSSYSNGDWLDAENDRLAALLHYRDTLKNSLTTAAKAGGGLPKMRHGRIGSQWRHVKQTNTYSGSNLMFIDGTVRIDDSYKYPIPRFGYPPMKRPQHKFSSSYNDLSFAGANPTTQSFDTSAWSKNDQANQRLNISQRSNRFQNAAKANYGLD